MPEAQETPKEITPDQLLMTQDGVELRFEEDALRKIARVALERHTGARGLRSIMENIMLDIMLNIPSPDTQPKVCVVTKEIVHSKVPVLAA